MMADVLDAFPGTPLEGLSLGRFLILYAQAGRVRRLRMLERGLAMRFALSDADGWGQFVTEFARDG